MVFGFHSSARFDAYYEKSRFLYIHDELRRRGIARHKGRSHIRKTACLYGPSYNVYIDTSDGVNEDIPVGEYAGRALAVVEDAGGKPFLYLKGASSPVKSERVKEIVERAGGWFRPFVMWHNNPDWYRYVWRRREELRIKQRKTAKRFDVGMAVNLNQLQYPKPDAVDSRVSWQDKDHFGRGSGEFTGYFTVETRRRLHEVLSQSGLSYDFAEKMPYRDYIERSFSWKAVVCPPGIGDYSLRIFDHTSLGQCTVMKETSYDFAASWRRGIAFIDFGAPGWEDQLGDILDTYEEWGQRAEHYFETYLIPEAIVDLFEKEIALFEHAIHGR